MQSVYTKWLHVQCPVKGKCQFIYVCFFLQCIGGYASKIGEIAFRKWFSRINEIRSIIRQVLLDALTATATTATRLKIMRALQMKNPAALIFESPNWHNISYAAQVINHDHAQTFQAMVQELKEKK